MKDKNEKDTFRRDLERTANNPAFRAMHWGFRLTAIGIIATSLYTYLAKEPVNEAEEPTRMECKMYYNNGEITEEPVRLLMEKLARCYDTNTDPVNRSCFDKIEKDLPNGGLKIGYNISCYLEGTLK